MIFLILGIFIALADQATKYWIRMNYDLGEITPVVEGFFNLTYLRNTGAAWGMFDGFNNWLGIISLVVLIALLIFRRSFISNVLEHKIALGCLVGGVAGNLIDRLRLGYVVDFLDFHIGQHHWPAFNVADSAICIGVGIYIISAIWIHDHPLRENGEKARSDGESREAWNNDET